MDGPSLFDDLEPLPQYGQAERIPITVAPLPELLDALAWVSDEAHKRNCHTTDAETAVFLSMVVLTVEQARVALGGREP